jgi:hypothetical protein
MNCCGPLEAVGTADPFSRLLFDAFPLILLDKQWQVEEWDRLSVCCHVGRDTVQSGKSSLPSSVFKSDCCAPQMGGKFKRCDVIAKTMA